MALTKQEKADYEAHGYLTGLEIFSEAEICAYREQFDELAAREGRERSQIGLTARHFDTRFIWEMSTDKRLLDAMQELMGANVQLLGTHFFCKYPVTDTDHFVAWHQDVTYWGLEPPKADSAWIAVDDSNVENGCMQVIPESHKTGLAPHLTSAQPGNLLSINQEIPERHVDATKAVNLCLKAGQVSIHTGTLYHASRPNCSPHRRCGLAVRFITTDTRQKELNSTKEHWQPVLVRGVDLHGHFPKIEPPFPLEG
ncbi:MAG: phytanoyl-CoA dioxygenase family protein [SAR324 cluster bacterium]|nr:phytanoyl-CoA dioxygenase family protein [SAR324 cluster bacterium]